MSKLTIFKASAGSGKTFRLVVEYLKLLIINPSNYKHILAVTFTNKATSEMKERILRDLYALSNGENLEMQQLLSSECGIQSEEIILNSKQALSLILHDYDRFSVSTIDSFFQGVLRSFARESGLYGSYQIDLDQDNILLEACDRLLMSVETDQELRNWLLMMSETQLEEGKNWQIRDKITELGKELNKERFKEYWLHQGTLTDERAKLKKLNSDLIKIRRWFENECHILGEEGLLLMAKYNLTLNDFKYKGSSFANVFNKLKNYKGGELSLGSRFLNAPDNPDSWPSSKDNVAAVNRCYHEGMNDLVKRVIDFDHNNSIKYYTASEIYKNIYALGVLSTMAVFVREVGVENNSLLISESDTLLKGIIGNNDAPFIYEKAGNYYHYFMIDEFQDTSVIQWENFKPLIVNSLSENNPNLVVGDVKQSIYRWRNSDWQLLGSKIKDELKKFGVIEKNLNSNWRSRRNIVNFNNRFFEKAATVLQYRFNSSCPDNQHISQDYLSVITSAFSDVVQISESKKDGGLISIQLIDDKSKAYQNETVRLLIAEIEKLQSSGIRASEIAILVRKNSQGNEIANALLNHRKNLREDQFNFEVISDDSLYLASSLSVRFLSGLFQFVITPWDQVVRSAIMFQFSRFILPSLLNFKIINRQPSSFLFKNEEGSKLIGTGIEDDFFPFFAESSPAILKHWSTLSIVDLENEFEYLYHLNHLPGEQASLQAFRDVIIDFAKKEGGNLHKFMEWWGENGNKLKVQTSVERDAIRILSIHKSKGLEFPIVMIPFCDWDFEPDSRKSNILWCPLEDDTYKEFPLLPVNYSKILQKTSFAVSYYHEKLLSCIDNLNLLYVAFTRAVDGLYVYAEMTGSGNTVSSLLNDMLCKDEPQNILENNLNHNFFEGELKIERNINKTGNEINLSAKIDLKQQIAESLKLHKNYDGFFEDGKDNIGVQINEGNIMHELLSFIHTKDDLSTAMKMIVSSGKIDSFRAVETYKKIDFLLQNPDVQHWFDGTYKVLNENTIISPNFDIKRPDRVMIKGNFAIVVDYKTTALVSKVHCSQVEYYVSAIKNMGFEKVDGYVWYLNSNRLINISDNFEN